MPRPLPHFCLTLPRSSAADPQDRGALIDQKVDVLLQARQIKCAVVSRDVTIGMAQQSLSVFGVHPCGAQPVAERVSEVMDAEIRNASSDASPLP